MEKVKVGDKIILEIRENKFEDPKHPCKGCFFFDLPLNGACFAMCSNKEPNSDTVKNIIFKQINLKNKTYMIDENKIKEAAKSLRKDFDDDVTQGFLVEFGFEKGAKWAVNEFINELWHPIDEEPNLVGEEIIVEMFIGNKRHTTVYEYMPGKESVPTLDTVRLITDWNSFKEERDNVKFKRWHYLKDLLLINNND